MPRAFIVLACFCGLFIANDNFANLVTSTMHGLGAIARQQVDSVMTPFKMVAPR